MKITVTTDEGVVVKQFEKKEIGDFERSIAWADFTLTLKYFMRQAQEQETPTRPRNPNMKPSGKSREQISAERKNYGPNI